MRNVLAEISYIQVVGKQLPRYQLFGEDVRVSRECLRSADVNVVTATADVVEGALRSFTWRVQPLKAKVVVQTWHQQHNRKRHQLREIQLFHLFGEDHVDAPRPFYDQNNAVLPVTPVDHDFAILK